MELRFKPKSKKSKKGSVYYKKSRFYVSFLLKKSPMTWTELTKSTGLHQVELKRILDDLLSSEEIEKVKDKYQLIEYPYWKYLDSPKRLKQDYLKKVNEIELKDIFVFDPLILFPIDKTKFDHSEIEEINKNCSSILNSTNNINEVIKNNRKKFIKEKILEEIEKARPVFSNILKKYAANMVILISSLSKAAEVSDLKYLLEKKDPTLSNIYFKVPSHHRLKLLKMIIKITKDTARDYPIILSTV